MPPIWSLSASGTVDHGWIAWRFVRDHWAQMLHAYPDNAIVRMLEGISMLADPGVATEIDSFFAQHPVPQVTLTLHQHLKKLRVNVALLMSGHIS